MTRIAAVLLVCAALAGCKTKARKKQELDSPGKQPLTQIERKRGEDACSAYMAQACRCGAGKPDDDPLARKCRDAQVKKETLDSLLAVDTDPGASQDSRARVQIESRKVIAKCVMEHASLPSLGCN